MYQASTSLSFSLIMVSRILVAFAYFFSSTKSLTVCYLNYIDGIFGLEVVCVASSTTGTAVLERTISTTLSKS